MTSIDRFTVGHSGECSVRLVTDSTPVARINISGAIKPAMVSDLRRALSDDRLRRAPLVELQIESLGGDDHSGFSMYEMARALPVPVIATAMRLCTSAAMTVFMAGDYRRCGASAQLLLHRCHRPVEGLSKTIEGRVNARDLFDVVRDLDAADRRLVDIMAIRTGADPKTFIADIDNENFLTPVDALELGLVHEIVDSSDRPRVSTIACFDALKATGECYVALADWRRAAGYRRAAEVADIELGLITPPEAR